MTQNTDNLYSQPLEAIAGFVFDQQVVRVFRDMISRSVPGYATLLSMLPALTQIYVQENSRCYDLGCSLGAATLAMRHSISAQQVKLVAIDNSAAMVAQCQKFLEQDQHPLPVDVICADITQAELHNASLVVMNFTLQFIPPQQRQPLISKIYAALNPGGALILSEKLLYRDTDQALMTDLHHTFKKLNGYSDLEISQKRSALENVLIAETLEIHQQRLLSAGFSQVLPWFQCFNFVSILAIK